MKRVWLSVHGRFHAFELASEIHAHQMLAGVATTYPRWVARSFLPAGVPLQTAPQLEVWRRLCAYIPFGPPPDTFIARAFGKFAARVMPRNTDILVAWSGGALEAIRQANRQGAIAVLERGSTHIDHQTASIAREFEEFGVAGPPPTSPGLVERERAEYRLADAISVPSRFAARTFMERGIPANKLIVNPYGADLTRFQPNSVRRNDTPVVLFVGGVSLRKGIPYLLRAARMLRGRIRLEIVGPIDRRTDSIVRREVSSEVTLRGPLRSPHIEEAYANADIFCLPSIEEGFPLALLQAMASALPVVTTPETGAEDLIEDGRHGLLVPARDTSALAAALDRLARDPELRRNLGNAARARLAVESTWADYGRRAVASYRALLSRGRQLERAP